nr:hypothetical protein [Marinicella sp. W31]MDC2880123.1 hypothetical protein [Marinicella sp. W31]
MTVIAYQLVIVFTLTGVRLLRSKLFLAAAWGWTAFSVINLFYPPLLFLQLAVVWGTYFLLRPRHQFTSPSLLGPSQPPELVSDTPRAKLQAGKQDLEEEARADEGFVGSLNSFNRELENILEATRLSNRKLNICSPIKVQTRVIETKFKLADFPTDLEG